MRELKNFLDAEKFLNLPLLLKSNIEVVLIIQSMLDGVVSFLYNVIKQFIRISASY